MEWASDREESYYGDEWFDHDIRQYWFLMARTDDSREDHLDDSEHSYIADTIYDSHGDWFTMLTRHIIASQQQGSNNEIRYRPP